MASYTKSAESPALILDLKPSKIMLAYLVLAHAMALLAVLMTAAPAILCLLILFSSGICYQLYGNPKSRWFVNRVCLTTDAGWKIRLSRGEEETSRLSGYYRHPNLVILNFANPNWLRRSVVLMPDSADPDLIRRLRVRLDTIAEEDDHDSGG